MNLKRNALITIIGISTLLFIPFIYQSLVLRGGASITSVLTKEHYESQDELVKQLADLKEKLREIYRLETNKTIPPIDISVSSLLNCSATINKTNTISPASHNCTNFKIRRKGNCSSVESYKKLNKKRIDHLEKICQSKSKYNNRTLYHQPNLREMFYFDKVQYAWCPSYKSASSSVISYMCPLYYGDNTCKNKQRNGAAIWRKFQFTTQHNTWSNRAQFVVVREPFARVLSSFKDKLENYREDRYVNSMYNDMIGPNRPIPQHLSGRKNELKEIARKKSLERHEQEHRSRTNKQDIDPNNIQDIDPNNIQAIDPNNPYENPLRARFPEFISALISGLVDPHWISINNYCAPCKVKYDYIIKVEDFSCEFNNFLMDTGHGDMTANNTEIWATNKGPSKSNNAVYEYYSKLSYEQLDQFYDIYLEDCILFDFNCKETLCEIKRWKALHSES